jgi:hypothetical protein
MHPANLNSVDGRMGMLRRFVVCSVVGWTMMALYIFISRHQVGEPTAVPMPGWVPFVPAFILPYLGLLLMTWLLPVAITDGARFRACLRANVCAYLLVMPWWVLTPTMLPRPPLPEGVWAEAIQRLWAVDRPYNIMPCAHGMGPMVVAWFVSREYPKWRWLLIAALVIGLPSIALTWQHRPIDILLGSLAAVVGIIVGEMWGRWEKQRKQAGEAVPV